MRVAPRRAGSKLALGLIAAIEGDILGRLGNEADRPDGLCEVDDLFGHGIVAILADDPDSAEGEGDEHAVDRPGVRVRGGQRLEQRGESQASPNREG